MLKTYLEIAALEPWHQAINEVADVITLNGVGGHPQVVNDLRAQGDLLASVCGVQLGAEQVQLRLRHFVGHCLSKILTNTLALRTLHCTHYYDYLAPRVITLPQSTPHSLSPATGLLPSLTPVRLFSLIYQTPVRTNIQKIKYLAVYPGIQIQTANQNLLMDQATPFDPKAVKEHLTRTHMTGAREWNKQQALQWPARLSGQE